MIKFEKFYFENKNASLRLGVFRIIFSLIIIRFVLNEEECLKFATEFEQRIFGNELWFSGLLHQWVRLIIFFAGLNLIGIYEKYIKWILFFIFIPFIYSFNFHLAKVAPPIWSYTTSIPFFFWAHLFSNNRALSLDSVIQKKEPPKTNDMDSFVISFLQIFILMMFFQSAVSKVMISGWNWFTNHNDLYFHIAVLGTEFGKTLLVHKNVIIALSLLTGVFEFFGIFVFLCSRRLYALVALAFHFGTWLILDIDFYFLYPLYLAIFFDLDWLERYNPMKLIISQNEM